MRTFIFLLIVLVSGAFAGLVHGSVNLFVVEPYLDEAIGIENQNMFESGEAEDTLEFWIEYEGYRQWQKGGQLLAGVILGTSISALFGIVYVLSKNSLPGNGPVTKALVLSGIMWLTIYLIPFLKYPANPPTVGETETVVLRGILYLTFIAISGLSAVAFYKLSKSLQNKRKIIALAGYVAFISVVFMIMPDNPDKVTAPLDLVNGFRLMSIVGVSAYWISLGLILGLLWNRFITNKEMKTYS